jgi:GT2 family glycosyltransferase
LTTPGSVWVASLELDGDGRLAGPDGPEPTDQEQARVLVRLHSTPLGFVAVPVQPAETLTLRVRATAESALANAVRRHQELDALSGEPTGEASWTASVACPRRFPARGGAGISIVICTRDRTQSLEECLRAVRQVDYQPLEILVVDNAPGGDETRELVTGLAWSDPRIRYTVEPRPGLSVARNHGLAQARYDLVAFTDDDAIVDPGWPAALAAGFASDPAAVCVTGFVPAGGLDTWSERYFDARYAWGEIAEPRQYDLLHHRLPVRLYPFCAGVFGTGANFAVSRDAVTSLGGFDTLLGVGAPGLGGEDLDMFLRLILAGGRICYQPSALVWHRHRSDPDALGDQIYAYGHGLGAYLAKHSRNRQLRAALVRHGPVQLAVTIGRIRKASRSSSQLRSTSARLGITEARGVVAGALRYRRAAHQQSRLAAHSPPDGNQLSPVVAPQHENSLHT